MHIPAPTPPPPPTLTHTLTPVEVGQREHQLLVLGRRLALRVALIRECVVQTEQVGSKALGGLRGHFEAPLQDGNGEGGGGVGGQPQPASARVVCVCVLCVYLCV